MIVIDLNTPIGNESEAWMYWMSGYEGVFSLAFVKDLFAKHPDETDFKFNIHCPGGEVDEGLAIYDCLRTSGRNIHMNIEGGCHSMAVTLLLAAPLENRSANPNCRALIHKVYGGASGSVDDLEAAAANARKAQNDILDIYAERTSLSREELESLMNEECERTAQELLEWGFISKINSYNTNFKNRKSMSKKNLRQRATEFINSIREFVGSGLQNFEFTDAEGNTVFTTEAEDDTLEVGMAASPDGTFTIADGRTVVIADGVITEIQEPAGEGEDEELTELRAENERLRQLLTESADLINELKRNIKSSYVPGNRVAPKSGGTKPAKVSNKDDVRAAIKGATK